MGLYINALEIMGGILTPTFIILLVTLAIESVKAFRDRLEYRKEKLGKMYLFDTDAEFFKVPNPTMIGVRLKRNGDVVWEGGIYKEEQS